MQNNDCVGGAIAKLMSDIKPYYSKNYVEELLGITSGWRKRWEVFCCLNIPDFAKEWASYQPLNIHQVYCLAWLNDFRMSQSKLSQKLAEAVVQENIDELTIESVMEKVASYHQTTETKTAAIVPLLKKTIEAIAA